MLLLGKREGGNGERDRKNGDGGDLGGEDTHRVQWYGEVRRLLVWCYYDKGNSWLG
jgi:hypothetical protein